MYFVITVLLSLCSPLQPSVSSTLLYSNVCLIAIFSKTLILCSYFNEKETKFHTRTKSSKYNIFNINRSVHRSMTQ